MHEFSVELRIEGTDLSIHSITEKLNLIPSHTREATDTKAGLIWGYNGSDLYDEPIYWESLETGLEFLLGKIYPFEKQIRDYSTKYEVYFYCGHFHSGFDGGPYLPISILGKLAKFGIGVYIDTYFAEKS